MQQATKRTVLITGSNKGIGFSIVEKLLVGDIPYNIISTSRNEKLGQDAVQSLKEKHPNAASSLDYHQLDISDEKSIDKLIAWLRSNGGKLDVLINNAATGYTSPNDEEKQFVIDTNFFSVVRLTEKLLPLLADDGKIIMLSSTIGGLSWQGPTLQELLKDEKLTEEKLYEVGRSIVKAIQDFPVDGPVPDGSYPGSKALLNTYTRRFLPGKLKKGQQYFSVCPGSCKTDLSGQWDTPQFPSHLKATPDDGADTPVYLTNLLFEKQSELNGLFIRNREVIEY